LSVLPVGFGSALGGYQIERSLRFNSADSARLTRTFGTPTNQEKWTMSMWVKRSGLGINTGLFGAGISDSNLEVWFDTNNKLCFNAATSPDNRTKITTQVFRDCSAWYHLIWAYDTSLPSDSNNSPTALKIYVNNSLITSFSTFESISSYTLVPFNSNGAVVNIGNQTISNYYFSGYMAEIYFIDGQALIPSSFGETDSATGVWKPKAYSGTYGTNGFYLNFSDNSGTTSTTLGKDSSGNSNNWTPNNFSVTAGVNNDSLVDSPTAYGTDTGVGGEVRGNYCTWNPLDKQTSVTIANGNLDATYTGTTDVYGCFSTFSVSSGKWYCEFTATGLGGSAYPQIGIRRSNNYVAQYITETYVDIKAGTSNNRGSAGPTFTAFIDSDVLGIAFNADTGEIFFSKNGTWLNSGNPAAGTGEFFSGLTDGPFKFGIGMYSSRTAFANFGQRAFAYTAPSGFKALCTTNLPTPTIGATSTTQANDYFNAVTYTGNGTSLSVTGVGFQPDLIWIKDRSNARAHVLQNAIAGFSQYLQSNATDAETTASSGVTAVGSDGFTVGTQLAWNSNTETYVAWNWNAGGSTVTNTSGTISAQVRANTTSGFSIVTYTGNGTNGATVGHGLGIAPSLIFIKNRGAVASWLVYSSSIGASNFLVLNTTDASAASALPFNNTAPTSSVFSLGTSGGTNTNGGTFVAYCFAPVAGYSAFGSYTGNAAADGPFIYTGFRPRFVIRKCSSATSNWFINDAARNPSNVVLLRLNADLSDAESSGANSDIDFLSNGFKIRATSTAGVNQSGQTHIYMAFAETPAKFSLAR